MNKDEEKQMRENLIDYIKVNDNSYADKNFDNYSTTSLVIIKTQIQLKLADQKRKDNEKI
ncbi:MAG: hypothetical protein Q7W45_00590 [Bacteroidota bacterium]|nr:hypothetical protein [Bacteroidota bacterium]MDP3146706.1 hypothetical protein [Bacteroidota bacterium]